MRYKMKFFGSVVGRVSGLTYHVSKDQIIEAEAGEFDESTADIDIDSSKKTVEISGEKAETATVNHKSEKRRRRK